MKNKLILILILPIIVMIYLAVDHFTGSGEYEVSPVPLIRMRSLDGNYFELTDFKQDIVVLNFWASWCPPCLKELPFLLEVARQFPKGVVILAVLTSDQLSNARPVMARMSPPPNFKFLVDEENKSGSFGTTKLPETYIIRNGSEIVEKISGDVTESGKDLPSLIRQYLSPQ